MVTKPAAAVHENPDANAVVIFQAPQQLALEWQEEAGKAGSKSATLMARLATSNFPKCGATDESVGIGGGGMGYRIRAISLAPRHQVTLWARDVQQATAMQSSRK